MQSKISYLKDLFNIFGYYKGGNEEKLKKRLVEIYGNPNVYVFENGRTAEYIFLKALELNRDEKVLTQTFTCSAVVNPIIWNMLSPEYVDIDRKTFSFDKRLLRKKLSKEFPSVVIAQHMFGIPNDTVNDIDKNSVFLLEDCAHALGNVDLGKTGHAFFLSFGVEKTLSTRVGGALIVNDSSLNEKVSEIHSTLRYMSRLSTFIWMLNPIIWNVLRKIGPFAQPVSRFLRFIRVFNTGFYNYEYVGQPLAYNPKKLPSVLCKQILNQMDYLEENLDHRKKITNVYDGYFGHKYENLSLIKYPVVVKRDKNELIERLKLEGYWLTTWYDNVIYPKGTDIESMNYKEGECPVSEKISDSIVNLPTGFNITEDDAVNISKIVKEYV